MKKKKYIVVLGAGESGTGAAVLCEKQGYKVFVSDNNRIDKKYKNVLIHHKIDFEEGVHSIEKIMPANEVIKSPGIPECSPLIKNLIEKGIPVISEIEFAARFTHAKLICITGSNGKTTTTLLTWHILKNAGLNVGLAGNVGQSFALQVAEQNFDYYVLEISSFQLDGMFKVKADIAILLNITPDHLNRYNNNFDNYIDSKFRITQNQTENDFLIYTADDPIISRELRNRKINAQLVPVSLHKNENDKGAYIENDKIIFKNGINTFTMSFEKLALQGKHNTYNSLAAGVATHLMEIRKQSIKQSLADFRNIAHRLEYVASVHGITFINDSKATNVNATWYALEFYSKPIVWIAGGVDKGNNYDVLKPLVSEKVKAIICLGLDNTNLRKAFGGIVKVMIETESAEEAVNEAYLLAKKNDTVLLSPACASFDLFLNFEERGELFKYAVKQL